VEQIGLVLHEPRQDDVNEVVRVRPAPERGLDRPQDRMVGVVDGVQVHRKVHHGQGGARAKRETSQRKVPEAPRRPHDPPGEPWTKGAVRLGLGRWRRLFHPVGAAICVCAVAVHRADRRSQSQKDTTLIL
jgi:hypothetical protein